MVAIEELQRVGEDEGAMGFGVEPGQGADDAAGAGLQGVRGLHERNGSESRRKGTAESYGQIEPSVFSLTAATPALGYSTREYAMPKRFNYRKLAFDHYDPLCADCGFGVPAVLEVAHIDGNRTNNDLGNLVILCPNCHKMLDLDLISNETIIQMRNRPKIVTWSKRMKDAGQKAALKRLRRAAARKAVNTRRRKQEQNEQAQEGQT